MSSFTSIVPMWKPRSGSDWARLALGLAIVGLIYYAYWVVKVGKDVATYRWLIIHWQVTSNYSHGPLIPLMAGFLVWWKRDELRAVRLSPVYAGLAVIVAAMFFYYVGIKAVEPRTSVSSFVLLLYGLTLALGGWELFKVLFFPITFLLLMVPLNFLDEIVGFPLRQFVAGATVSLLNWFGIEAYRMGNGTGIYSSVFRFDVADPCSGIRSLMALTTVTAFYGYITQRQQWKRWVLFLSAMPLAVLGNLARVLSIALVAEVYGQDLATKIYHDWSGFILFPVALTAMVIIGLLMNFPYRRVVQSLLKPAPVAEKPNSERFDTVTTRDVL